MDSHSLGDPMKQLTRRQREKQRHRKEILDIAEAVFSKKGYHKSTIREIAKKAEFATATIYKFFKNKEDLYTQMILEKTIDFVTFVKTEVGKETTTLTKMEKSIRAKISYFLANVSFVTIYFAETRGSGFSIHASLDKRMRKEYDNLIQFVADLFDKGIKQKVFFKAAPYDLALALDGLTNAFLFSWLESEDKNDDALLNKLPTIQEIFFGQVGLKKP